MTAVAGGVTPELVRQKNMEATMSSRTSQSRVALSMGDHIHRAELYFQSHKKALAALELERHQLAETRKKIVDSVAALVDQRNIAKRHADALPPYDERSHAAMSLEIVELDAGISTLHESLKQLDDATGTTSSQIVVVTGQLTYLQSMVTRDKCITASEAAPKATDITKQYPVTGKVHELLPSIFERGSSVSGARVPSPRCEVGTPSLDTVNGLNWPSIVTATHTACCELGKSDAHLRHRLEANAQHILTRCRSLRSQVLKQQTHSIDSKVMQRQRILVEVDALDGKIFDARQQWRITSDAVQKMKEPLKTSSARHEIRETVADNVGQALVEESALLAKSRHDLKKLCRSLAAQVEALEIQRKVKMDELSGLDGQLRQDRAHCHLENPVGILARPHPIKVAAIRTFPHLLQSREIFGRSTSSSPLSPRNDGGVSSAFSSGRGVANAAAATPAHSPQRVATPRVVHQTPFDSDAVSPRHPKIPAAPRK